MASNDPDVPSAATARRHDISPSLLFTWRKALAGRCRSDSEAVGFAPAVIVPDRSPPVSDAVTGGHMEVMTVTGQRILIGADVDASALARVVSALEGR